jgi:hypothetical protein
MAHGDIRWTVAGPQVPEDSVARLHGGGTYQYTARELRDAHFDLKIPPDVFDETDAELGRSLDHFNVPEREKGEVLAAFGGWKGEVTAGSMEGAVNWRRWR